MSGPRGSRSRRGTGGVSVDCSALLVDTTLNSPEPSALNKLKKGDRLSVEIGRSPLGREILLSRLKTGEVAGSLTPPQMLDIMTCIKGGHSYVAEVVAEPAGGECRLRIQSGSL